MKTLRLPLVADPCDPPAGGSWTVPGGCPNCGGALAGDVVAVVRTHEQRVRCAACGAEAGVRGLADGASAAVRLPYGADDWTDVESSDVAAVGRRGPDLLVRFAKGGVYRYPGAGDLLPEFLATESKGRFVHRTLRPRGDARRLCARYGCGGEPAGREPLCRACLERAGAPAA